jgi:hypothetical protein
MERQPDRGGSVELTPQVVTMMTTEHFTLQTAQSQEIADINGRMALYIGAVSSTLIALAFIGQIYRLGTAFYAFSLVLFPLLFFMGLVTFERVTQSTYAVIIYARGISRIRHLYIEYAPYLQPYLMLSTHDDSSGILSAVGIQASPWQSMLTAPGMIAAINSVIAGVFAGLLLYTLFGLSLQICTASGVVIFLVSAGLLQSYNWKYFKRIEQIPALFPSQERR